MARIDAGGAAIRGVLVVLALSAAPLGSQPLPPQADALTQRAQRELVQLDVDGSGALERFELRTLPHLSRHFGDADFDQDGRVTAQEYRSWSALAVPQPAPPAEDDA
jgi:hypothetical protein